MYAARRMEAALLGRQSMSAQHITPPDMPDRCLTALLLLLSQGLISSLLYGRCNDGSDDDDDGFAEREGEMRRRQKREGRKHARKQRKEEDGNEKMEKPKKIKS